MEEEAQLDFMNRSSSEEDPANAEKGWHGGKPPLKEKEEDNKKTNQPPLELAARIKVSKDMPLKYCPGY